MVELYGPAYVGIVLLASLKGRVHLL